MVCPEDYEVKAAQLKPLNFKGDAIALRDPRPDIAETVAAFEPNPAFDSIGSSTGATDMRPYQE